MLKALTCASAIAAVAGFSVVSSPHVRTPKIHGSSSPRRASTARFVLSNPQNQSDEKSSAAAEASFLKSFFRSTDEELDQASAYQISDHQDDDDDGVDTQTLLMGAGALFAAGGLALLHNAGLTPADAVDGVQRLIAHPQDTLQDVISYVEGLGPMGPIYFGLIYLVAEILAVPATPLTLSAGYLFGLTQGVTVVLIAATIAASVGFFVGKTFLRTWVEDLLQEKPELAKVDKAIGQEGFKLLLLVRLSPIFPFALSNYVYGASSIDFPSYFWGTLLGFAPGTFAYVYTGMVGQALTVGEGSQPWYVYAGGFAVLLTFLKLVTDVASEIVNAIGDEEEASQV